MKKYPEFIEPLGGPGPRLYAWCARNLLRPLFLKILEQPPPTHLAVTDSGAVGSGTGVVAEGVLSAGSHQHSDQHHEGHDGRHHRHHHERDHLNIAIKD